MEKPLNLKIQEFKTQMINIINEAKLPAYILEPIMKDFHLQLQKIEQEELMKSQKEYQNSLKAEKNEE